MSSSAIVFGQTDVSLQGAVGFKNKIINGDFFIHQRGTSQTNDGFGSLDRWSSRIIGSSTTQSRETFTSGQTDVPGNPIRYLRRVVTSVAGAGNYSFVQQPIENVTTFAGQTITVSFYAKADATKFLGLDFRQEFGGGGSAAVTAIGGQKFTLTTSWQKFTTTVAIPSVAGKTVGPSSSLLFRLWMDAGSDFNANTASMGQQSGTFDIARVQIEAGSVATPFEDRPISTELSLCQRYYQRFTPEGTGIRYGNGLCVSATKATILIPFFTPMRIAPTAIETSGTASDYTVNITGPANVTCSVIPVFLNADKNNILLEFEVASGLTGGQACMGRSNNGAAGYLGWSAEFA